MWKNERIFKNVKPNFERLKAFGFKEEENFYSYFESVLDGNFNVNVYVSKLGEASFEVVDNDTLEEYTLAYVEGSQGAFVGAVREALNEVVGRVIDRCYDANVFKNTESRQIIDYVFNKYGEVPEFLWESTPNNAVFRMGKRKKWYAVLLTVSGKKIGLPYEGEEEILNLKAKPKEVLELLKVEGFFPAYHMNKKHWYTVALNGTVPVEEIYFRIDESYKLVSKN